ncbi:MAG: DUF2318 domain-containing protein [Deltaproteobacteria bacterium]|nr:DUF2318 domain-containing protein [Deltaproteobacteria bacterium]
MIIIMMMLLQNLYMNKLFRHKTLSVLLSAVVLLLMSCSGKPNYPEPRRDGQNLEIEVRKLRENTPVFFSHHYKGKRINFFAVKSGDKVLSFFDGCSTCYKAKLGYRFENGQVVCKKCNLRYSMAELETGFGGCFPIRIEGHIQGNKYIIPVSLIEKGHVLF